MLDLGENGFGCNPFIAAIAELAPDTRRTLLIRASVELLRHCDRDGAAACMKHAFGLENGELREELKRVIDGGLDVLSDVDAADDEDDSGDGMWHMEDVVQFIDEVHSDEPA